MCHEVLLVRLQDEFTVWLPERPGLQSVLNSWCHSDRNKIVSLLAVVVIVVALDIAVVAARAETAAAILACVGYLRMLTVSRLCSLG
jgi:uncharacterized membrane protein YbaN (DUF454 family)